MIVMMIMAMIMIATITIYDNRTFNNVNNNEDGMNNDVCNIIRRICLDLCSLNIEIGYNLIQIYPAS